MDPAACSEINESEWPGIDISNKKTKGIKRLTITIISKIMMAVEDAISGWLVGTLFGGCPEANSHI